jgi:hypothetical protein
MSQQILPPMTRTSFKARIQQLSSTLSLSCGLFLLLSRFILILSARCSSSGSDKAPASSINSTTHGSGGHGGAWPWRHGGSWWRRAAVGAWRLRQSPPDPPGCPLLPVPWRSTATAPPRVGSDGAGGRAATTPPPPRSSSSQSSSSVETLVFYY